VNLWALPCQSAQTLGSFHPTARVAGHNVQAIYAPAARCLEPEEATKMQYLRFGAAWKRCLLFAHSAGLLSKRAATGWRQVGHVKQEHALFLLAVAKMIACALIAPTLATVQQYQLPMSPTCETISKEACSTVHEAQAHSKPTLLACQTGFCSPINP
jgi:hypothetical protein